jgi:hypothetical protein
VQPFLLLLGQLRFVMASNSKRDTVLHYVLESAPGAIELVVRQTHPYSMVLFPLATGNFPLDQYILFRNNIDNF